METRERRRRGFVGPLILIAVGVIFLLGNLGVLSFSAWEVIFRLWPVVLITIGLEVLIGRRSTLASVVVVAITLAIIGVALYLMPAHATFGQSVSNENINQPLEGARNANIDITFGAGAVRIGELPDPNVLVQGTVAVGAGQQLTHSFRVSGDTAFYSLTTRNASTGPFFPPTSGDMRWDLNINRDVPAQLTINGGIGTSELNLSQLHVTALDVKLGVGKTTITMPATGQVRASISGGVGDVEVVIPAGMAARIQADAGLGGVNVPPNYQHQNNVYTSPDYDTAQTRVDLTVRGGVGRVAIQ